MSVLGIVSDEQSYSFRIFKKDESTLPVRIIGWVIEDDHSAKPVTFPSPGKGERLQYQAVSGGKWLEV